jgi:hypothetical protein
MSSRISELITYMILVDLLLESSIYGVLCHISSLATLILSNYPPVGERIYEPFEPYR